MTPTMSTTPLDDRVTAFVGDKDHFLRHVSPTDTEFKGRHDRHVETDVTDAGAIVHNVFEAYASDAHGESVGWRFGIPSGHCSFCGGSLSVSRGTEGEHYIESTECEACPFKVRRASVDAPVTEADSGKPVFYRATVPHNFDEDPDIEWERHRDEADDVTSVANLVRALSLGNYVGRIRDDAYDSDEKEVQTVECGVCDRTIDSPASETHPHYGDVCSDCSDATVWSPEDADLPEEVEAKIDEHASFTPSKLVSLLRDVIYYADYKRTRLDADDDANPESIPDGISTGTGGKIDATGTGRGVKGTGLRRPKGAFHGDPHWRTVLGDAKETGLIERVDGGAYDDDHEAARWVVTEHGRDVFAALARCQTCGERKNPYNRVHVYQTSGRHTKKNSRLALACPNCDSKSDAPGGMTIASSAGSHSMQEIDTSE